MQKRFVLHVGLPKTATSAFQSTAYGLPNCSHREFIEYLSSLGIARTFYNDEAIGQARFFANAFLSRGDRKKNDMVMRWYIKWLAADKAPVRLISDEMMSNLRRIDEQRAQQIINEIAAIRDVQIVLVIRPFFSWVESLINQSVKHGSLNFERFNPHNIDSLLPGWTFNYVTILEFFKRLIANAQHGANGQLKIMKFSASTVEDLLTLCDQVPDPMPGRRPFINKSPTAYAAVTSYFEHNNIPKELLPEDKTLRFIGLEHIDKIYPQCVPWMERFVAELGWTMADVDDVETARANTAAACYITEVQTVLSRDETLQRSG